MFSWWSSGGNAEKEEGNRGNASEEGTESTEDRKNANEMSDTAKDLAKNFGSFLYSVANAASKTAMKVKDTVKETVEGKDILTNFNEEQEKFVNEKQSKRKETGVPPWVGYHEEETMKTQILALSSDERNFLRDPPSGVQFHYDYDSMFPVALATLDEDPELRKMRFNLVPKKVKEKTFWRNYFYRVSLIKQSSQLTSLASVAGSTKSSAENLNEKDQENKSVKTTGSADTQPIGIQAKQSVEKLSEDLGDTTLSSSPPQEEFISDTFEGGEELSKEDLQQIGMGTLNDKGEKTLSENEKQPNSTSTTEAEIPDWERELQEELQEYDVVEEGDDDDDGTWEKEIEDMLEAEVS